MIEILANSTRIVIMSSLVNKVIQERVLKFYKIHTTRIKLQTYFVTDSNKLCTRQ
jgi:hypothetical protein